MTTKKSSEKKNTPSQQSKPSKTTKVPPNKSGGDTHGKLVEERNHNGASIKRESSPEEIKEEAKMVEESKKEETSQQSETKSELLPIKEIDKILEQDVNGALDVDNTESPTL